MEIIWLQRPRPDIPWGFRLAGGREFGQPLSVQKVNPGSVSCHSLCIGDIILKINNRDVTTVTHSEGQTILLNAGNLLQLTIKKCGIVAASAPVSPTPMSKSSVSFTAPTSPTSLRSFSPDGFSNYRNFFTDDDNARYFTSLPRHASVSGASGPGMYEPPHQYHGRKNSAPYGVASYTMPKPTPYRPSGGNMSTTHTRSGSDSSGYQTSSYGPSPNTFDSPLSTGTQPANSSSASYKHSPASYGPGPGIAPPSYDRSIEDRRGVSSSSPNYQRQYSSGSPNKQSVYNQNGNMYSPYESPNMYSQNGDTHGTPNRSYGNSTSYSPFQRQPSRESARHNTYEQSDRQDYPSYQHQPADVTQSGGGYHRQQSSEYQRQPSYGTTPQSPLLDRGTAGPPRRQLSQGSGVNGDHSTTRGFQRQGSFGSDREVVSSPPVSFQRQTSSGSFPKSPVFAATVSSTTSPNSNHVTNEPTGSSGLTSYGEPTSPSSVKSGGTGINSIEDILSPFEKFPNYYNEFINSTKPTTRHNVDRGLSSDLSDPSMSYKSPPTISSEPARQHYADMYSTNSQPWGDSSCQPRQLYGDQMGSSSPGIPPPPSPPVGPPPPPPPPPPPAPPPAPPLPSEGYVPTKRPLYKSRDERTPGDGSPVPPGMGHERAVPDAVLTQMMKKDGNAKPFAYITGGIDLKEFKNKRNRPPPPVMPKSYRGPALNEVESFEPERPRPPTQSPQYQPSPAQYQSPQLSQYEQQQQYLMQQPQYQQQNNQSNVTPIRTPPSPPVRSSSGKYYRPLPSPDLSNRKLSNFTIPPRKTIRYSEKPLKDIEKSAVYQMIQESQNEGGKPRRGSGMKDPLLRHNAEDDEMRFSGLHKQKDSRSKAFMRLNKMTDGCDAIAPTPTNNTEEQDEPVGRYDQTSIRYTGGHIPSPSFRVLQHWAEVDPLPLPPQTAKTETKPAPHSATQSDDDLLDDYDDGLPDTLSGDELVDRRYMGGYIPSKAFRALQRSIGKSDDDVPHRTEEPEPVEPAQPTPPPAPPAPRKLMITTQSRAVPPPPEENTPSTDF